MSDPITIGMRDAKANFSKLIGQIESGSTHEIILTRAGKPAAKLIPIATAPIRLGVADGRFHIPDDIDTANLAIEEMFLPPTKRR